MKDKVDITPFHLSLAEEILLELHNRGKGSGTFTGVIHIDGIVEKKILEKGLIYLQKKYSRLRAAIYFDKWQRPYFHIHESESVSHIPLEVKIVNEEKVSWDEEAKNESQTVFDSSKAPLCRVKVLINRKKKISYLIITFHHSIADGISLLCFVRELLSFYESLENGKSVDPEMDKEYPVEFVSGIISSKRLSFIEKLKFKLGFLIKTLITKKQKVDNLYRDRIDDGVQCFFDITFNKAETDRFFKQCDENLVRLQSALCASLMLSVSKIDGKKKLRLLCSSPINARKFHESGKNIRDIGCFTHEFRKICTISEDKPFWKIVREYHYDLHRFIEKKILTLMKIMEEVHFSKRWPIWLENLKFCGNVSMSNFGNAKFKPFYGTLKVDKVNVLINNQAPYSLVSAFCVIVKGCLNISLIGSHIKSEDIESLKDNFIEIIKTC